MASNPEIVRLSVLKKLQEALDEEDILADQILTMMHCYADRFTNRRVEINNLMVLQDHPLVDYVCKTRTFTLGDKPHSFFASEGKPPRRGLNPRPLACEFVSSDVVVESSIPSCTVLNAFTEEIVAYEKESDETHDVKKLDALCTLESFVTHSNFDTPCGTVYYIPKVSADVLLVKRNVYDSVDDCVVAYMKYAAEAGFVVRRSCQKRLRNGDVKQKCLFCNRKGCPKAFEKAPSIVVTGQDGAMRNAIEAEFAGSKHRLCMWHITQKLPAKICAKIYDETDFKEKLNKIVWNMYIGPKEFEYRWGKLMEEFKLENHKWLTKIFNSRSTWIPAYFIDSLLCGLMRTTSRLESENSFFSHFTNSGSTLMNFMNCFETAMEKQRYVQEMMDHKTIDTVPKLKTFLKIERHASNVYTRSLFELVQKKIFVGLWHCQIDSKSLVEGSELCIIKESPYVYEMPKKKKKKSQSLDKCKDVDKCKDKAEEDDPVDLFFKKDGLYKNLIHAALRNQRNIYGEKNVVVEKFTNEATSIVDYCVHLLRKDEPRLGAFVEKLKSLKKDVEADCPNPPLKNKIDNLEQLLEFRSRLLLRLTIQLLDRPNDEKVAYQRRKRESN
uniref:Protein FAR1-related sequence 5-like n=1 Tax=Tanacetum cinerariifolium TaxID=118510 RepID=A0A6L2JZ63_TANCI|nr:protein FAR1-related sequence 5-like [Tanacetum cinerariifolium]